ncbi:MAG: beta-N-acetylhexosaminidase [Anaerolineae bacterium]|nr:beta-N-acetylhexosaminidase [Anaerolineae bacterium]
MQNIIPKPHTVMAAPGVFRSRPLTRIVVNSADPFVVGIARQLADALVPVAKQPLPVSDGPAREGDISLALTAHASVGSEGYLLTVTPTEILIRAFAPAGLFYGTQTLRQLLPPSIPGAEKGGWEVAAGSIHDVPRFAYRGAMLDVARHFIAPRDIKKYIDIIAAYKLNHLHLHLTDDQGWRIEIRSWDKLATHGGSTSVGGGAGGYYTQAEYRDLVEYAASRHVTIVPEIDMPGHTSAVLSSYPELNRDGIAPALYTGVQVGFSSLDADKEITYAFVEDVVREIAALTPGPYIHIGGDEAQATPTDDYVRFIERVQGIVNACDKQMMGWEEIGQARLDPSTVAQHWNGAQTRAVIKQALKLVLSPATFTYLDMKYDAATHLGQDWAGELDVKKAYDWEPTRLLDGIYEQDILGVEAPLWTETISTLDEIEYMAFPRLLGIAEIGWSQPDGQNWEEYSARLAAHGPRLRQMGVNFFAASQVDWK